LTANHFAQVFDGEAKKPGIISRLVFKTDDFNAL
jgi:hypothetical protein